MAMSDYEIRRQESMANNHALLVSLGLDKPFFEPKEKPRPKQKATPKKRKAIAEEEEESSQTAPAKVSRISSDDTVASGTRRSSRNVGKVVDYKNEQPRIYVSAAVKSGIRTLENEGPLGKEAGDKRVHNPKTFGSIPGIEVGTWWESRQGCSADAIHAPWVAGISGGNEGAYSVALSGGYDDDVDLGYAFTYTGSGGRDLKGTATAPKNLRTAPQSSDQTFENSFNKALKRSSETRKPIRVIRGYKLKSLYAPSEGYRYDGLYVVEKAWMEKGLNPKGYMVCKFAFKRLPNQPALPIKESEVSEPATSTDTSKIEEAEERSSSDGKEANDDD